MPLMRGKIVSVIQVFSAASIRETLDTSNLDRIFSAAGCRPKALLIITVFSRFFGMVAGISALSLEI